MRIALILALVTTSGCYLGSEVPFPSAEPEQPDGSVEEPAEEAPWYARARPSSPACRTVAERLEQRVAAGVCHALLTTEEPSPCVYDARIGETACGDTVLQWEAWDGSASVFVDGAFDAELSMGVDPSAMRIRFDSGLAGVCQLGPTTVTLCVHADPRLR